jgi:hypothetical protein
MDSVGIPHLYFVALTSSIGLVPRAASTVSWVGKYPSRELYTLGFFPNRDNILSYPFDRHSQHNEGITLNLLAVKEVTTNASSHETGGFLESIDLHLLFKPS